MSKLTLTGFALLLLFLGNGSGNYAAAPATATAAKAQLKQNTPESQPARSSLDEGGTGTLQKMIVENGSVTMDLDSNWLNEMSAAPENAVTLQFAVAANSFFSILVFNDLLRGPEQGSMALISHAYGDIDSKTLPRHQGQARQCGLGLLRCRAQLHRLDTISD
jgi:hypothetical protein